MRIIELFGADSNAKQMTANLTWAMQWIIDHKRWDVLNQVEEQRHDLIHGDRTLLYYLAAARLLTGEAKTRRNSSDVRSTCQEARPPSGSTSAVR